MKTELTYELKQRFFAQYFGQNVSYFLDHLKEPIPGIIDGGLMKSGVDLDDYLLLRNLRSLTDGEKLALCQIMDEDLTASDMDRISGYWAQLVESFEQPEYKAMSHEINPFAFGLCYDYLRSIGAAVPFMGHTVEELVEVGWIKLREVTP